MNTLTNTGRILFGIPFILFGMGHFMNAGAMGGYVPIPGGVIWIYITGAALVLAGIAAITKIQGKLAMILLAVMLIAFIATIHIPNLLKPETMAMGMMGLYKDLGLAAGAIILAGLFQQEDKKAKTA